MELLSFKDISLLGDEMSGIWKYRLGFEKLPVYAWIDITPTKYGNRWDVGLLEDEQAGTRKKQTVKVEVPSIARCDNFPIITDDMVSYIFGIGKKGSQKHKKYLEELTECYNATQDEAIAGLLAILPELKSEGVAELALNPNKLEDASKRIIFYYKGERIMGRPKVKKYWQSYFLKQFQLSQDYCCVTGKKTDVIKGVIPLKLKRIVGGLPTGSSLVSFDKEAFSAYTWKNGQNALLDVRTIIKIYSFLNFLSSDKRFHRYLATSTLLYWSPQVTIHSDLFYSDWDMDELIKSVEHDKLPNETIASAIVKNKFLMTSGTQGLLKTDLNTPLEEISINFLNLKGNSGRTSIDLFSSIKLPCMIKNLSRLVQAHIDSGAQYFFTPFDLINANNLCITEMDFIKSILFGERLPESILLNIVKKAITIKQEYINDKILVLLNFYLALTGEELTGMNRYAFLKGQKSWLIAKMQMLKQNRSYKATDVARFYEYIVKNDLELQDRLAALAEDYIHKQSIHLPKRNEPGLAKTIEMYFDVNSQLSELEPMIHKAYSLQEQAWFLVGSEQIRKSFYKAF